MAAKKNMMTMMPTTIYHLLRYHIAAYLPLSWRLEVRAVCRAFNDSLKDVRTGIHRPMDISVDVWKMWMADTRNDYDRTFLPVMATRQGDSRQDTWVVTYTILDPRWYGFPTWAKKDYREATPWLSNSWICAKADNDEDRVALSVDDARSALACMAVPRKSKRKVVDASPHLLHFHHRDAGKMNAYDAAGRPRYMVYHQLRDADCHFDMRRSIDTASAKEVINLLRRADTDRYRARSIVATTDADFLVAYKGYHEYQRFLPTQYVPTGHFNVSRVGGSFHVNVDHRDLPGTDHPIMFTIAYDGIPFDVCNGHMSISRNPPKELTIDISYTVRQPVVLVSLPRWSEGEGRGDGVFIDNVACFVNPRDRIVMVV